MGNSERSRQSRSPVGWAGPPRPLSLPAPISSFLLLVYLFPFPGFFLLLIPQPGSSPRSGPPSWGPAWWTVLGLGRGPRGVEGVAGAASRPSPLWGAKVTCASCRVRWSAARFWLSQGEEFVSWRLPSRAAKLLLRAPNSSRVRVCQSCDVTSPAPDDRLEVKSVYCASARGCPLKTGRKRTLSMSGRLSRRVSQLLPLYRRLCGLGLWGLFCLQSHLCIWWPSSAVMT